MQITDTSQESYENQLSESDRDLGFQREDERKSKWTHILDHFKLYAEKCPAKLSQRLREGLPSELRAQIWKEITKTSEFKAKFGVDVYQKLVTMPCVHSDKIELDLHRTFPNHSLFMEKQGAGQISLRNVMRAYSNYDSYVGYCQGMTFLAGLLLMELEEEDAFFALVQIMNMHRLRGTYQPGLPGLSIHLAEFDYQLKYLLPEVHKHLEVENVRVEMFASSWFITIFVYQFPLELVLHVWDVFLFEGMEIVFRVSLAIMKLSKDALLSMDFEGILNFLRKLPDDILNPNRLMICALNAQIDQPHLDKFFQNYHQEVPSSQVDEPVPQQSSRTIRKSPKTVVAQRPAAIPTTLRGSVPMTPRTAAKAEWSFREIGGNIWSFGTEIVTSSTGAFSSVLSQLSIDEGKGKEVMTSWQQETTTNSTTTDAADSTDPVITTTITASATIKD